MSNQNAKFQVNFKTPAGTLVNIYADSVGEGCMILEEYMTVGLSLIQAVEAVTASGIAATAPAPTPAPVAPVAAPVQEWGFPTPTPAPAPAAPAWTPQQSVPAAGGVPTCEHGEPMRLVPAGISKAGKPYKAFYACPRPRGEACNAKA